MICEKCGRENKDNARFCSECGKALIDEPIELDLKQINIPAVSRKPKIIKVSMANNEEENETESETESKVPAKDVNSIFLPKDDGAGIPPLDIHEGEEPVKEFIVSDNNPDSELKPNLDVSDFAPDFEEDEEIKDVTGQTENSPMSIGGWIGTFILTMIPGLNIILLLVWAISKKTKKSKKTFAAAVLIFLAIAIVLGFAAVILLIKFANFHPENYFNTKT